MGKVIIKKLNGDVEQSSFNCGNSSINFKVYESYYPTLLQHAYAYRVEIGVETVGYYMIKFRTIKFDLAPEEISSFQSTLIDDCCAIHVSYIAVKDQFQNRGIGSTILRIIVAQTMKLCETFPIALITLDALKEKYEWYLKKGFHPFDDKELEDSNITIPMYINCIIDRAAVNNYTKEI